MEDEKATLREDIEKALSEGRGPQIARFASAAGSIGLTLAEPIVSDRSRSFPLPSRGGSPH
jgi:hypothetical protein